MTNARTGLISGLCAAEAVTKTTLSISQAVGNDELIACQAEENIYLIPTRNEYLIQ
jgi:hypothetical protein